MGSGGAEFLAEYHVADKKNDGLKPSRSIISEKAKSRDACYLFFFLRRKIRICICISLSLHKATLGYTRRS